LRFFFADERILVKKTSRFIFLIAMAFLMPVMASATDKDVKGAADKTLAALEMPPSAITEELRKDEADISKKEDLPVSENKTAPVATVSDVEKKPSAVSAVKAEKVRAKAGASKTSSAILPEKKTEEILGKPEDTVSVNPADMQRRWKALFSKEIEPDSIAYTVKSGDSLYVLARKHHTTVDLIKKINGLKSDNIYPKMKLKIHTAPFSICIDKSKNVLVLYSNGEAVKKYSVATGKKNCTPVGEFRITDKLVNPTWFKTGAILPPGSPDNALGTRWMGFDKPAYGIHGTIEPKSIGTQASEGCIRMLNEDVEELYSIVPIGTKVTIQD
jgi:lipoprotein-anchoring transpeptidase ErfK/SrfK